MKLIPKETLSVVTSVIKNPLVVISLAVYGTFCLFTNFWWVLVLYMLWRIYKKK